jgi:tetratricopeptide (TPR) repeat protein
VAYSLLGQYQQAVEEFDQAIQIDPEFAGAYYHRAVAYGLLGQYQQAIEDFDRAIQIDPEFARVSHILGTDAAPQATAVLVQGAGNERSILIVAGLPRLPSGIGYQVWRIRDEGVTPVGAGTFNITDTNAQLVVVSATFSAAEVIGVSAGPAEGSTAPIDDFVLLGKL